MSKKIRFGFMSPSLRAQLGGSGITKTEIAHFERDQVAILRLHIRGLINDNARDRALRRLVKAIEAVHDAGKEPPAS